jgi:xanthine dehydrogenase accessory factor
MRSSREARRILARLQDLTASAIDAPPPKLALVTLIRVKGSAYRREGAKMLVEADGQSIGTVSGGCVEQDVREVALEVIRTGVPQLRTYCSGSEEISAWDLGMGCDGEVEVYIEPINGPLDQVSRGVSSLLPIAICTWLFAPGDPGSEQKLVVHAGGVIQPHTWFSSAELTERVRVFATQRLKEGTSGILEDGDNRVFVDVYPNPTRLVVVGAGDDAEALVNLADSAGFQVALVDWRSGMLNRTRFPQFGHYLARASELEHHLVDDNSYVVLMTHSFARDVEYLRFFAGTSAKYIGILGPRRRSERLLTAAGIEERGVEDRIFAPIGLDIGADGAEQVAVAIIAEILAVVDGRRPVSLREKLGAIHANAI